MILAVDSQNGKIMIGSPPQILPGIYGSLEIGGSLSMESSSVQGSSGSTRTVHGWDDADVSISLILIDDPGAGKTRYDYAAEITQIFKKIADDGGPELYVLQHPLITAWKIRRMLFADLRTTESRGKQQITVSLQFVEHESTVATTQERQSQGTTAQEETAASSETEPQVSGQMHRRLNQVGERYVP